MKKILFLIHDLGPGGAEKVLVNLVNNMDREQFDITVLTLFGGGVNEQFLKPHIRLRRVFPRPFRGNIHLMKLLSPERLHRLFIREKYDIEVSYLEGPSARIISGCPDPDTKLVSWIHIEQRAMAYAARPFRSPGEAEECYLKFRETVCVSETVRQDFLKLFPRMARTRVLYNTNETAQILEKAREPVEEGIFREGEIALVGVGKLTVNKGFDRIARVHGRLRREGYPVHTYLLGEGPEKDAVESILRQEGTEDSFTFLGYRTNPYKYVKNCHLFLCASFAEGFSTAATEALILGVPVCTVEVSGMKEMLGQNREWGIVTENDENALYAAVKGLLEDPALLAHYRQQAALRGKTFHTQNTVKAVEEMLNQL